MSQTPPLPLDFPSWFSHSRSCFLTLTARYELVVRAHNGDTSGAESAPLVFPAPLAPLPRNFLQRLPRSPAAERARARRPWEVNSGG